MSEVTPMMRQYLAIKREVPRGAILMFRLGDFYEMFGEDAAVAAPILGATLTRRGSQQMCGVPHHALNTYLAKLIRAGKTAALCDQVEDPKTAKGLVRREITRIVTPGTVTEDGLLDETVNNYIASVSGLAVSILDLSTGNPPRSSMRRWSATVPPNLSFPTRRIFLRAAKFSGTRPESRAGRFRPRPPTTI